MQIVQIDWGRSAHSGLVMRHLLVRTTVSEAHKLPAADSRIFSILTPDYAH
jgi:hypothetical protein